MNSEVMKIVTEIVKEEIKGRDEMLTVELDESYDSLDFMRFRVFSMLDPTDERPALYVSRVVFRGTSTSEGIVVNAVHALYPAIQLAIECY